MAAIEAGIRPFVIGVVLVLRKPAETARVRFVVRPGIASEPGEVFVQPAAIRNVHTIADPESRGLHLPHPSIGGVWSLGVPGLRCRRIDVDGAGGAGSAA